MAKLAIASTVHASIHVVVLAFPIITSGTGHAADFSDTEFLVKFSQDAFNEGQFGVPLYKTGGVLPSVGVPSVDQLNDWADVETIVQTTRPLDVARAAQIGLDRWLTLSVPAGSDILSLVDAYEQNSYVEWAEPAFMVQLTSAPNDPLYTANWGHDNTRQLLAWDKGCECHGGPAVGDVGFDSQVEEAWGVLGGYGDSEVIVGIIDTGVELDHSDLAGRIWLNDDIPGDQIDNDGNGYVDDTHGFDFADDDADPNPDFGAPDQSSASHGTRVAGVAAGTTNNGIGVAGVAGGATIMPLKIMVGIEGSGDDIAEAIVYATDNGAHIISMSFFLASENQQAVEEALTYAAPSVLAFASSGNAPFPPVRFPARSAFTVAVGAASPCAEAKSLISCDEEWWWSSTHGADDPDDPNSVSLLGPTILPTTDLTGQYGVSQDDYDHWFNGTSCAAPYVAGVAALIKSQNPGWTPEQVRDRLLSTCTDVTKGSATVGWDQYTGYGLVNAARALGYEPPPPPGPRFVDKSPDTGLSWSSGIPHWTTVLDGNDDGLLDVQVQFGNLNAIYWKGVEEVIQGVPRWSNATSAVFPGFTEPSAGHGPANPVDYDNDGDLDLFVPANVASDNLFYEQQPDGTFFEKASAVNLQGGSRPLSYRAAWADYDGDGWVDVALGGAAGLEILRNVPLMGTRRFEVSDATIQFWPSAGVYLPGAIAWLDIEQDGDLDVIIGESIGPPLGGGEGESFPRTQLLFNDGLDPPTFAATIDPLWDDLRDQWDMVGIAFGEIIEDGNSYPDIVLLDSQGLVLRNDGTGVQAVTGVNYCGRQGFPLDYDLDGDHDVLFFSGSAAANAGLLRQEGESFVDVAAEAAIDAVGITAGTTADFDGDGDLDLFQGDPGGSQRLYMEGYNSEVCFPCAPGEDDPVNNWLSILLDGHPWNAYNTVTVINTDLIGAFVRVEETGQGQWVQGTAGTVTPPSVPMTFGLADLSAVTVTVVWPNRTSSTFSEVAANQALIIKDESIPYVEDSTVSVTKELGLGTVTFEFRWYTVGPGDDDSVSLTHLVGGGSCYGYAVTIGGGSSGVTSSVSQQGINSYRHVFRWENQPCYAPCMLGFTVTSSNGVASSTSGQHTVRISSCIGG